MNFGYSWIKYWESSGFSTEGKKLDKWIGLAHNIRQVMTNYVLKQMSKSEEERQYAHEQMKR